MNREMIKVLPSMEIQWRKLEVSAPKTPLESYEEVKLTL